jgi:hypothetical protein
MHCKYCFSTSQPTLRVHLMLIDSSRQQTFEQRAVSPLVSLASRRFSCLWRHPSVPTSASECMFRILPWRKLLLLGCSEDCPCSGLRPTAGDVPPWYGPIVEVFPDSNICVVQPTEVSPSLALLEFIRQTSVDVVGLYWDSEFIRKSVWSWIDIAWLGLQSVANAVGIDHSCTVGVC